MAITRNLRAKQHEFLVLTVDVDDDVGRREAGAPAAVQFGAERGPLGVRRQRAVQHDELERAGRRSVGGLRTGIYSCGTPLHD